MKDIITQSCIFHVIIKRLSQNAPNIKPILQSRRELVLELLKLLKKLSRRYAEGDTGIENERNRATFYGYFGVR